MADPMTSGPMATILQKTDPFVLDQTIEQLEALSPGASASANLPMGVGREATSPRPFLETSFNKGDSGGFREPWKAGYKTNPGVVDPEVAELEASANEVWDAYRQLYYGTGSVGSVYVRRRGDDSSAAASGGSSPAKKASKGKAALEALFGIRKSVSNGGNDDDFDDDDCETTETALWESVHLVSIEAPSADGKSCEYRIRSRVWCRYKPPDVGDVPKKDRPPPPRKKKPEVPREKQAPPKPKKTAKALDVARLEIFDRAADNWDSHHKGKKKNGGPPKPKPQASRVKPGVPLVPATVTSSAVYTKETTKVCTIVGAKKAGAGGLFKVPPEQHICNLGAMIEKIEADLRSKMERVDAPRCAEILTSMYRPTLSPGLRLPARGGGMVSRLGGHAVGMGVGRALVGEIALLARSKGLGGGTGETTGAPATNAAMEGLLARERNKLVSASALGSEPRGPLSGLSKTASLRGVGTQVLPSGLAPGDLRSRLKKTKSAPRSSSSSLSSETAQAVPSADFARFRNNLKSIK